MRLFSTSDLSFNGILVFVYNGESYEAKVIAKANYYYQPCVMYFKDGSGQPEDDDLEVDSFEVASLRNEDTDTDCFERYNQDKVFRDEIDEAISDELYEMDWDKWSSPEQEENDD